MRKIFFVFALLMMVQPCWAATVRLNNGEVIEGNIAGSSPDSVSVDISGVSVTFLKSEVSSIEGDDAAAVRDAWAAPVAEPLAETTSENVSSSVDQSASVQEAPLVEISAEKRELIRKFIDIFGTREAMHRNFDQMMAAMPPAQAGKFRDAFRVDDIVEELVPLYDKHFTESELNAFINFYTSADGQKLVSTVPLIMQESVGVTAKYFEKNMPSELKDAKAPRVPRPTE